MKKRPFFSIVAEKQVYLDLVYILFAFPLSLVCFCFIATGLSLSIGLLIVVAGLFIFALTLMMVRIFRKLEIHMMRVFLGVRINNGKHGQSAQLPGSFLHRVFASGSTWKSFVFFLFVKFPIDLVVFSITVSFVALTLQLLLAPAMIGYEWFDSELYDVLLDYLEDPYILPFMGIILLFISLHVIRGLAWIYRWTNPVFLQE